jgi:penicillin-binding protein 1A
VKFVEIHGRREAFKPGTEPQVEAPATPIAPIPFDQLPPAPAPVPPPPPAPKKAADDLRGLY